jgi:hypothetical protein
MNTYMIYPRCFTTRLPNGQKSDTSEGDAQLTALWDLYVNKKVDTDTWSFRKDVLACALRLFKDFRNWTADQSENPNIVGYNLEFLKDTLNYIATGVRRMGVPAWLELCTEIDQVSTIARGSRLSDIKNPVLLSTTHAVQQWCSWPNGFEDLLYTMQVLFGESRDPETREPPEHRTVGVAD